MKQRHHAEHNKNNTSKILVVDDIGLCRRVRFSSLSFRSRRKERALEQKRKVPLPRVPCLFGKDNESYFFLLTYSLPLFLSSSSLVSQVTTNQLEQLGFKDSPMATSGKEAIEYIERQGEVHCILLDIMMPQETGRNAAKIRKHDKVRRDNLKPGYEEEEPIKVIAVTALKHEEVLSLCESSAEAGHSVMFDGYIEAGDADKDSDAVETSAIMSASSLPSGLDLKAENNNNNNSTKILAAIAERGNSDGGSGGSDPTTDGGGSGGRGAQTKVRYSKQREQRNR